MAGQLAKAEKIPVSFTAGILEEEESNGERVCCSLANILRAWSNIVSNGVEHTDRQRGIEILTERRRKGEQAYLRAAVRDCGPGFSIAKKFLEEQGDFWSMGTAGMGRERK